MLSWHWCHDSILLRFSGGFSLLSAQIQIIAYQANSADQAGDTVKHRRTQIPLLSQQVTAEGGTEHRGDPGNHGQHQKGAEFNIRQSYKVGQQVFWRAGDKIQKENQEYYKQQRKKDLRLFLKEKKY